MMSYLLLLCLYISICHSNMEIYHQLVNPNLSNNFEYFSIDANNGNIATLSSNTGISAIISYLDSNSSIYQTPISKTFQFNLASSSSVRVSPHTNIGNSTAVILIFNQNQVIMLDSFLNSLGQNLDFSNYNGNLKIKDVCFGEKNSEIFIYGELSNTSDQVFILFNGSTIPSFSKIINISSSSNLDKLICQDSRIYTSFDTHIGIYSMDSTFTELFTLYFSIIQDKQYLDFQVSQSIFLYSNGKQIKILNSTSFEAIANYSHANFISGAKIVGQYVFFVDNGQIIQYDFEVSSIVNSILLPTINTYTLEYLSSNILILLNQPTQSPTDIIFFYNFSSSYNSNTSNCLPTYVYSVNELLCIKNRTISANSSLNASNTSISSNSTNSTSNSTNLTNQNSSIFNNSTLNTTITINSSLTQTNNIFNTSFDEQGDSIDALIRQYFIYLNKNYGLSLTNGASSLLILSSFKISPQFLYSLVIIFDDLWFYQFHNKTYPHSVQIIFQNVDIIQTNRLNVWFLQLIQILNTSTNFALENNNKMQKYLSINSLESSDVFFTRSLIQNSRNSILLSFICFIILKLLKRILFSMKVKFKTFSKFFRFISRISQWWLFVSSVFQILASKVTFDFGIQIMVPSYLNLLDKTNLFICFIVFFSIFIYSLSFYPLVFCSISKTSAQQLMNPCRYQMKSFFFQPSLTLLRAILRSFVHSLFLKHYTQQIFLLLMIDFLSIGVCLKMRKYFKNPLNFCFYTLYMVFLGIFDIFFYFQGLNLMSVEARRELFATIVILSLFVISILVSVIKLTRSILKIVKGCKKSKIMDQNKRSKEYPKLTLNRQTLSCNIIPDKKLSLPEKQTEQESKYQKQKQGKAITKYLNSIAKKHETKKRKSKYKKNCLPPSIQIKDKQLCKIKNIIVVKILDQIKQQYEIEEPQITLKKNSSQKN